MYRVVVIADASQQWFGNGMTFETVDEAVTYAQDLHRRWTLVENWRVLDADGAIIVSLDGLRSVI